jgi:uncharacterized repeat protein (TIGR03803 family)
MQLRNTKSTCFSCAPLRVFAALAVALSIATAAAAQTETVLYNFTGGADGRYPSSSLVLDAQGNVYGASLFGGDFSTQCGSLGCGLIFEISPEGVETIIHTFSGTDGIAPNSVIRDMTGNLYGTVQIGATNGYGAVLKLTPAGMERILYNFTEGADGTQPRAGIVHDAQGNLYGTTEQGGYFGGSCGGGCGTVFKVTPAGAQTVLYSFTPAPDANYPTNGVALDAEGNVYGTTFTGGVYGFGTVYKVTPQGVETILYSFTGQADGRYPNSNLILDAEGNLYGTTQEGGYSGGSCGTEGFAGCGTVFQVSSAGVETVLYSFKGLPDGNGPVAGLIRDAKGNFYGTTELGGANAGLGLGAGSVFKMTPAGKEKVLYSFTAPNDGAYPLAGLVMDKKGNLYGTTEEGGTSGFGSNGYGTVFKLVP